MKHFSFSSPSNCQAVSRRISSETVSA